MLMLKESLSSTQLEVFDDILGFTERKKIKGFMLAIDFKKAFDSLNRSFMSRKRLLLFIVVDAIIKCIIVCLTM